MSDKSKLEITWIEKDNRPKLEPVLFDCCVGLVDVVILHKMAVN